MRRIRGRFEAVDGPPSGAIIVTMLDTEAHRLDVAEVVRVARRSPAGAVRWRAVDVEIAFDEDREVLVLDDDLEIDLERIPARVPSTGRMAPGPVLARCPRGCGRRARVLWLDPRDADVELFPVCRGCARVEYATATASELERARIAHQRLRARLGLSKHATHEPRPYQRRRAYQREATRLKRARERVQRAEVAEWQSLARQLGWKPDDALEDAPVLSSRGDGNPVSVLTPPVDGYLTKR